MKNTLQYLLLILSISLIYSCRKDQVPTITTSKVTSIMLTTASGGGTITDEGSGTVLKRGVCWSINTIPTTNDNKTEDGGGGGTFTSNLTGLDKATTYRVRAYATNSAGTGYGKQLKFATLFLVGTPVTDIDGNTYKTVIIGSQEWMAENLKTTKYNDGSSIPLVTDNNTWAALTAPGYCWYDNDEASYRNTYGALYNWFAVNTNKLCPVGWHVPSDEEWHELISYVDPFSYSEVSYIGGGKLKESGTTHWDYPNDGATNETGFTALPGGDRYNDYYNSETFWGIGTFSDMWSSTEADTLNAIGQQIYVNMIYLFYGHKQDGYSVRCLRD